MVDDENVLFKSKLYLFLWELILLFVFAFIEDTLIFAELGILLFDTLDLVVCSVNKSPFCELDILLLIELLFSDEIKGKSLF